MRKKLILQLLAVAVLLTCGLVGFFPVVGTSSLDLKSLGRLVIANPEIAHITAKPSLSEPAAVSSTNLPSLEQGYGIDPGQTGAYNIEWFGLGTPGGTVQMFLELLPNQVLATQADTEQVARSLSASAVKALDGTTTGTFSIPGVAKSQAIAYSTQGAGGKKSTVSYTALIEVDRAVDRIEFDGAVTSRAGLEKIARREAALLSQEVPGWPSMAGTTYPAGVSALWFGVLALLVGLVFLLPFLVTRARTAKVARKEARRRYGVRSRGSKVIKRHRAARR